MLLLFAIIDKLHAVFKESRSYQPRGSGGGSAAGGSAAGGGKASAAADADESGGGSGSDEWVGAMRERLQKHDQSVLTELVQTLRDYEEELLPAADATEVFDVLGVLGDVLGEASSADAWLGLA